MPELDPAQRRDLMRSGTVRVIVGIIALVFAPVMPVIAGLAWLDERALENDLRDGIVALGSAALGEREYSWPTRGDKAIITVQFTDRGGEVRYGEIHEPDCARDVNGDEVRYGSRVRVRYDPSGERTEVLAVDTDEPCSENTFKLVLTGVSVIALVLFGWAGLHLLRGGLRDRAAARAPDAL